VSDFSASLAFVRDAMAALPAALASALECALPVLDARPRSVLTTGIGASEGPARVLAAALAEAGIAARFCPMSCFVSSAPVADLLVVFSQGLSPNARLALAGAQRSATCWLVTSVDPAASPPAKRQQLAAFCERGFVPIVVPPLAEAGTLVRLVGPTVAMLAALRLSAHLLGDAARGARLGAAPSTYRPRAALAPLDHAPLALVTIGTPGEQAYAHRWKLLESLLRGDPPVWDVLQFAHGPLQTFHDQRLNLLVLETGAGSALLERLTRTLNPERHRVIHVPSAGTGELAFFEHAATIDALLLATLEAAPRDLFDWPARGGDGPLYGLGAP
jgi:fructoselysine-6-P-deglycase FrlB-like protein